MMEDFEQVAEAYLLARQDGDLDALARLTVTYPAHEHSLLAFALLDAAVPTQPSPTALVEARAVLTPSLKERALASAFAVDAPALIGLLARGEALGLSARALAAAVDLPRDLLLQLDRRLIAAASVPRRCLDRLAASLQTSAASVQDFLAGGPSSQVAAYNFAPAPPQAGEPQSFAEALAASGLATAEQRASWQVALVDEGLAG